MCDGSLSRGAAVRSCTSMATTKQETRLSDEQLAQAMELARGADGGFDQCRRPISAPPSPRSTWIRAMRRSARSSSSTHPILRSAARDCRTAPPCRSKGDDTVVKLRPVVTSIPGPPQVPDFGVEVDAMPGGFVCSAFNPCLPLFVILQRYIHGDHHHILSRHRDRNHVVDRSAGQRMRAMGQRVNRCDGDDDQPGKWRRYPLAEGSCAQCRTPRQC